ncbi:MAG: anti-sigma factor antagonist [Clostridia bacterium]|nr:anti-sigma factor antagonist [Clostridia bacterium]
MYVQTVFAKGDLTAMLVGDIDHHTAREMRKEIDALIEKHHPTLLRLDFSTVGFMDSSGIGLIMGRYRLMHLIGGNVLVCNVPSHLRRMIDLSGIGSLGILEYKGKEVHQ